MTTKKTFRIRVKILRALAISDDDTDFEALNAITGWADELEQALEQGPRLQIQKRFVLESIKAKACCRFRRHRVLPRLQSCQRLNFAAGIPTSFRRTWRLNLRPMSRGQHWIFWRSLPILPGWHLLRPRRLRWLSREISSTSLQTRPKILTGISGNLISRFNFYIV